MNLKRIYHYEFWPFWVFYIPAYFYYFWLALKARKWVYFSVLNPCMNFGGAFLSSKFNYLKQLPDNWKPKTIFLNANEDITEVQKKIKKKKIHFPLIVKPDMGERGKNVKLIATLSELNHYLKKTTQASIVQEYITYPIELGILFYWDTANNPKISSVGIKAFCEIVGTGTDSLAALVKKNLRIAHRVDDLKTTFSEKWHTIIPKGEKILMEPIGNHNLGTKLLDARKHFSTDMLRWTAECVRQIPGFDYGRLDVKIKNWDAFKSKDGIKVLEINGVNAEPLHIYDPSYSIWGAYRDIFYHMDIIYTLSKEKLKNNTKTQSLYNFFRGSREVLKTKNITQILEP